MEGGSVSRLSRGSVVKRNNCVRRPQSNRALVGVSRSSASSPPITTSTSASDGSRAESLYSSYALNNYAKPEGLCLVKGEGCRVWDAQGRSFLDFTAGIAVNALGHSHPRWVEAVQEQAGLLTHVSNLFHSLPGPMLMKKLSTAIEGGRGSKVFLCNSGTEANEAAIKFARKWKRSGGSGKSRGLFNFLGGGDATEVVAFDGGFHGRTMGALSITSNAKYRDPFGPTMPGARFAPYNDIEGARAAIKKGRTCAVFVEPIQGEGGVNPSDVEFLAELRRLCDEAGALLVFDEVQCGLGRTGWLYAHEKYGVVPDMITLAKPLANGLPIGALVMRDDVAAAINPGDHGSTFAGGPLVCAAALAVIETLEEPGFLENVQAMGKLTEKLVVEGDIGAHPDFAEFRGAGLLMGIQMTRPVGDILSKARDHGLLVCSAGKGGDVIRLLPPLIVSEEEVREAISILERVLTDK